jgi:hypothetical protein
MPGLSYKSNQLPVDVNEISKVLGVGLDGTAQIISGEFLRDLRTKTEELDTKKESLANKDSSTSLGTSNTKYPTQGAVKGYVDSALSGINTQIESRVANSRVSNDSSLSSSSPTTNLPTQNAVKVYVGNEISGVRGDLTAGLSNKLDTSKVSTSATLDSSSPTTTVPTQSAVKSYVSTTIAPIATKANDAVLKSVSEKQIMSGPLEAVTFLKSSDIRLKECVIDISDDLIDATKEVKFKKYKWAKTGLDSIGVIAQDLPDKLKFLTGNHEGEAYLSVEYIELLILKVLQLEKEIELLKSGK